MRRNKQTKIATKVLFTGIADRGLAVGRTAENQVVFVKGPVPGDVADVTLLKKRKGVFQGTIDRYVQYSPHRTDPFCAHFEDCGGCKWQHLSYEQQLKEKEIVVKDAYKRIAGMEAQQFIPILGAGQTTYYRNKLEFSFSNKKWLSAGELDGQNAANAQDVLGFHAPGSFEKIVPIDHCYLQPEPSNQIRNFIRDFTLEHDYGFWDAKKHTGLMRNMIVRTSSIGEIMLTIIFSRDDRDKITGLLDAVYQEFPDIDSLMYVVNQKMNDSLYDQEFILYKGKDHILEKLGEIQFIISPKSFFQTNTRQSEKLYDIALSFADFQGHELVYDLYTGIGSIALYLAKKVRKVTGIELVQEAIVDARKNALLNKIENAIFMAGDVKDLLTKESKKADVVMIDPPRAGMHKDLVDTLLKMQPEKLVYISCNPATQARDVALLNEKYQLIKVQPVDMFPHTHHIESVALLHLKNA